MEVEEAYLFSSSKVTVQGHLFKKFRHLDHCGQVDIPRTIYAVSVPKLSLYTSYGSGRIQLNFKVKVTGFL